MSAAGELRGFQQLGQLPELRGADGRANERQLYPRGLPGVPNCDP